MYHVLCHDRDSLQILSAHASADCNFSLDCVKAVMSALLFSMWYLISFENYSFFVEIISFCLVFSTTRYKS